LSKWSGESKVVLIVPALFLLLLLFAFGRDGLAGHVLFVIVPPLLTFRFLVGDCIDRCRRSTTSDQVWLIRFVGVDPTNFEISWTTMNSVILGLKIGKDTGEWGDTDSSPDLKSAFNWGDENNTHKECMREVVKSFRRSTKRPIQSNIDSPFRLTFGHQISKTFRPVPIRLDM
jgi:hypothetical protein